MLKPDFETLGMLILVRFQKLRTLIKHRADTQV